MVSTVLKRQKPGDELPVVLATMYNRELADIDDIVGVGFSTPKKPLYARHKISVYAGGHTVHLDDGYRWNGADIPRFFWSIVGIEPLDPRAMIASGFHDKGTEDGGSQVLADGLFVTLLRPYRLNGWVQPGVGRVRAAAMYTAVRLYSMICRPVAKWLRRHKRIKRIVGTLFRAAILIGVVFLTHKAFSAEEPAAKIFREHCYQCHGTKRDDWDASKLDSAKELGEEIIKKISADKMPPGKLPKLTAEEKSVIKDFLAGRTTAGKAEPAEQQTPPPVPPQTERQFLSDGWVIDQIRKDATQPDSLYVSLANLYNDGATKEQLAEAQGAVSKAANLLSTSKQIVLPKKVDASGIVLRLDTAQMGWEGEDVSKLLEAYPYAFSSRVFVRGDWFIARGLRAPLYYQLLGVPNTERATDAAFGIDRQRFIDRNLVRRAALTTSGVAYHNRAIEWAPSNTGAVRLTYDTRDELANRKILSNPLGFDHDATEYIADLPNGLHLYAAFDGQGRRQDKVPENIAGDPGQASGAASIVPGISCVVCHKGGIKPPPTDTVRNGAPLFSVGELAKVTSIYPTKDTFEALLTNDKNRYLAAHKTAVGPFTDSEEPIGGVIQEYNKPLTLAKAARESETSENFLKATILASGDLQALGLRPLTENQTVTRDTWESSEGGVTPAQRIAQLIGR